jgi:hypothetical protein
VGYFVFHFHISNVFNLARFIVVFGLEVGLVAAYAVMGHEGVEQEGLEKRIDRVDVLRCGALKRGEESTECVFARGLVLADGFYN